MKAILVIDMPESCFMCPFRQKVSPDDIKCWAKDEIFEERFSSIQTRINCPLKPIPQKLEYKGIEDDNIEISKAIAKSSWYRFAKPNEAIEFRSFAEGYNNCIDEILGEENETSRTKV